MSLCKHQNFKATSCADVMGNTGRWVEAGLKDATLFKKIFKIKSLVTEGIDVTENVKITNEDDVEKLEHLHDVDTVSCTVDTISHPENRREVTKHIAGYVAKHIAGYVTKHIAGYVAKHIAGYVAKHIAGYVAKEIQNR